MIGSPSFWCPETPNYVVGVCAELVIVAGHSRTFVWAMPGGELIAVWARRDLHGTLAITRDRDDVLLDQRHRRLRVEAATGATRAEEPAVPAARLVIDDRRKGMTLTSPDGVERHRTVAWTRVGSIARDGSRYALDENGSVRVYDAATDALVHTSPRGGTPTLSADGRYLVVSLLGPPRTWIEDIDGGVAITPPEPPGVYSVTLGHRALVVVDDGVWSLDPVQRIATVGATGSHRVIRGEQVIGLARNELGRWRLDDGAKTASIPLPARGANSLGVDAAGRYAVLTLDDSHGLLLLLPDGVWLADLDAGTLARIIDDAGLASVAMAPAGDRIAIVDEQRDTVRVVDRGGATLSTPAVPAPVRWAQFSPDGERLLVVGSVDDVETAYLVDLAGAVTTVGAGTWRGWLGATLVRRASGTLEQVDPATGAVLATMTVEPSPTRLWLDEHRTALASNDGCLRLRDLVWRTVGAKEPS